MTRYTRILSATILASLCLHMPSLAASPRSYAECAQLANQNPSEALKEASSWLIKTNSVSAQHCKAIALFALKRYDDSAAELAKLERRIYAKDKILWGNVMHQMAKAWRLSGMPANASNSLDKAISRLSDNEDTSSLLLTRQLLEERSDLNKSAHPLLALQDLDHALSIAPQDIGLRLKRGVLLVQLKEFELARQDLQLVLSRQPNNSDAKQAMAQIP